MHTPRRLATSMPWCIIDASLIYGASRILFKKHEDPNWQYRSSYRREDDQALFMEFLHALLFYRKIILENSSMNSIGSEILDIIKKVNSHGKDTTIVTKNIGVDINKQLVIRGTCN